MALIRQWEEEIKTKLKTSHHGLTVFVYHQTSATPDKFKTYDVVITTYGTLASQFRKYEEWLDQGHKPSELATSAEMKTKVALLHPAAKFHRVILDESQCIKNKETQTAKACCLLVAQYRWCLTGTPMMNGIKELYSPIHFLRIPHFEHWPNFAAVGSQSTRFLWATYPNILAEIPVPPRRRTQRPCHEEDADTAQGHHAPSDQRL